MTQKKRTSIFPTPPIEQALKGRDESSGKNSGRISEICDRYLETCRRSIPDLSADEWWVVCDTLNGTISSPQQIGSIPASVADSIALDGLDKKWGVDGPALSEKLAALSYAQLIAVQEVADQFWRRGLETPAQALELVKARGN